VSVRFIVSDLTLNGNRSQALMREKEDSDEDGLISMNVEQEWKGKRDSHYLSEVRYPQWHGRTR
jgi:hypothetical protein